MNLVTLIDECEKRTAHRNHVVVGMRAEDHGLERPVATWFRADRPHELLKDPLANRSDASLEMQNVVQVMLQKILRWHYTFPGSECLYQLTF